LSFACISKTSYLKCSDQGSHAAALTIQLKVLHGRRAIAPGDNADVVAALSSVAATYCSLGKLQVGDA
jgi:hypothetical protein